jgi:hypothetical protein
MIAHSLFGRDFYQQVDQTARGGAPGCGAGTVLGGGGGGGSVRVLHETLGADDTAAEDCATALCGAVRGTEDGEDHGGRAAEGSEEGLCAEARKALVSQRWTLESGGIAW